LLTCNYFQVTVDMQKHLNRD